MIIPCASLASQPVSESVREREISIEMKTEMETDGDKEADKSTGERKRVQRNKVRESRPCRLLLLSEQALPNGTKCCNQRVEAGKHKPSSCLYYLDSSTSYSPGSSNAFSEQEETTSQCHVNQEHSLWTVANNYSDCHRTRSDGLTEEPAKRLSCVSADGYSHVQLDDIPTEWC